MSLHLLLPLTKGQGQLSAGALLLSDLSHSFFDIISVDKTFLRSHSSAASLIHICLKNHCLYTSVSFLERFGINFSPEELPVITWSNMPGALPMEGGGFPC